MFKSSAFFAIAFLVLSGRGHGQEKKDVSVPAFLMPATVVRTTTSQPRPSGNSEPDATVAEIPSTHKLEYRDPTSGTRLELHSAKPIRIVADEKDGRPIRSAGEKKSEVK